MAYHILSIWLAVNRPSIVEWWRTLLSSLVVRLGDNQLLEKILRFVGNNGQFSYPGENPLWWEPAANRIRPISTSGTSTSGIRNPTVYCVARGQYSLGATMSISHVVLWIRLAREKSIHLLATDQSWIGLLIKSKTILPKFRNSFEVDNDICIPPVFLVGQWCQSRQQVL